MPLVTNCCGLPIQTPFCPFCGQSTRGEQLLRGQDLDEEIRLRTEGVEDVAIDAPQFLRRQGLTVVAGVGAGLRQVTIVSEQFNGDLIFDMNISRRQCVRLLNVFQIPIQER